MMDLKCGNINCRIETFKGESYTPMNVCPVCNTMCFAGGYIPGVLPPVAYPVPDPIKVSDVDLDEVEQVIETVARHVDGFAASRRAYAGPLDSAAIALGNLSVWLDNLKFEVEEND